MSLAVFAAHLRALGRPWTLLWALVGLLLVFGPSSSLVRPTAARAATVLGATTYTSNTTWTTAGSPYILNGDVTVATGATLTIDPGVVVKFNGLFRLLVVNGRLNAVGTSGSRIVFTSYQDDTVGGDSNGDGAATSGAAGQWSAIRVSSGNGLSELKFVDVKFGGLGSANWNYGALELSGASTSVTVEDANFTSNQRSAIKVGSGTSAYPGVTVRRTTMANNGSGVSVNQGWASLTDQTLIRDSSGDGLWFNLTDGYTGPTSTLYDSEIRNGGGRGVYLQAGSNLGASYWPHGNRNNIYANVSKQLDSLNTKRVVDWKHNYWGEDVYYYVNPAGCSDSGEASGGHLGFHSSAGTPPNGPVSSGVYYILNPGFTACSYDKVDIAECAFSSSHISSGRALVAFEQPKNVSNALACASDVGADVEGLESDFPSIDPNLSAIYLPEPAMTDAEIALDYEPMIESLFDELTTFGDYSDAYPGSAPVRRMNVALSPATVGPSARIPVDICFNPWWPVEGSVSVGPTNQLAYPGQRRVYQTFTWDAANLLYLKSCRLNLTVEPDAVFDRSDAETYLGTKVAKLSNLPRKYDDTRKSDPPTETSYTVGTGDAQQLVAGRRYYTLIRTKLGNSSTDEMFVRFQNGARFPEWCYSTWCIFPAEVGSDEVVIPKWVTVPGQWSWTH